MQGKIWGVPVVIIVLALVIALLVDLPMFLLHATTQKEFTILEAAQENSNTALSQLLPIPTPTPTATPSATPVLLPKAVKQITVTPVPTSGRSR